MQNKLSILSDEAEGNTDEDNDKITKILMTVGGKAPGNSCSKQPHETRHYKRRTQS